MPYTEAGKNIMLDALARGVAPPAGINAVSLHTAEPNKSGSNEVASGEYARQKIEWDAAAAGVADDKTNGAKFKVPAKTTIKFVGYWSDNEGTPVFVGWDDVEEETFNAAGEYTLTDAKLNLAFTKE